MADFWRFNAFRPNIRGLREKAGGVWSAHQVGFGVWEYHCGRLRLRESIGLHDTRPQWWVDVPGQMMVAVTDYDSVKTLRLRLEASAKALEDA